MGAGMSSTKRVEEYRDILNVFSLSVSRSVIPISVSHALASGGTLFQDKPCKTFRCCNDSDSIVGRADNSSEIYTVD